MRSHQLARIELRLESSKLSWIIRSAIFAGKNGNRIMHLSARTRHPYL